MVIEIHNFASANAARAVVLMHCKRNGLGASKTKAAVRHLVSELRQGGSAGMGIARAKGFIRSVSPAGFGGAA
jgi:hypothetical protein